MRGVTSGKGDGSMNLIFDGNKISIEQVNPDKLLVFFEDESPLNSVVFKSDHYGDPQLEFDYLKHGYSKAFNLFPQPGQPSWCSLDDPPNEEEDDADPDDDDPDDPANMSMRWDFDITDGVRPRTISFHLHHGMDMSCTLKVGDLTIDLDLGDEFWAAESERCRAPRSEQENLRFAPRMEAPPEGQLPSLWERLTGA
jgi:hypothetical protein